MKILVITNLFPNQFEPTRGIYNKQQVSALSNYCELKVVAPMSWLSSSALKLESKNLKNIKNSAEGNVEVCYPKYFMTPKVLRSMYGYFFFFSIRKLVKKIYEEFNFDLIYSPWAYPDGFGSYLIGKEIGVPVVIGALGSDINYYTKFFLRRKLIVSTLSKTDNIISVSSALKDKLMELGVPKEKINVVLNGIDTKLFKLMDQSEARERLLVPKDKKTILFIGNLVAVKGVSVLIKAFKIVAEANPDCVLHIIGDGNLRVQLIKLAKTLNLENKVKFLGRILHKDIPVWLNSCDVFCLPSLQEGCPNVILEALACGSPIVASRVGGIPELIKSEKQGYLVEPGNYLEIAKMLQYSLDKDKGTHDLKIDVNECSWEHNAEQVYNIFKKTLGS